MYTFVQVREGQQSYDFEAKSLNIVLVATHVKNAVVNLTVRLTKKGAKAVITGIVIAGRAEKLKLHTMQIHNAQDTTSDLLVKTVLSDRAVCLYDGGILVEKKAQKTDAYQRNENLLLSGRAYAESKPSLEILANDVRCTHGATTGPMDQEQLWYLSSRGLPRQKSEALIVEGFLRSALMRIGDESIMEKLWRSLTFHS